MFKKLILIFCVFSISCQNKSGQLSNLKVDSADNKKIATHLKDTSLVNADCVVFLTPDSTRFESYKEEEGIYEADSDFGFWLTDAIDSMKTDKSLRGIVPYVTEDRFIKIKDCSICPAMIDRDTINYGILLISKKKGLQINSGLGGGNYIGMVRDYFK